MGRVYSRANLQNSVWVFRNNALCFLRWVAPSWCNDQPHNPNDKVEAARIYFKEFDRVEPATIQTQLLELMNLKNIREVLKL